MSQSQKRAQLLKFLHERYNKARKDLLAAHSTFLETAHSLNEKEKQVRTLGKNVDHIFDHFKAIQKRAWSEQLIHQTPEKIPFELYEPFEHDGITAYIDVGLVAAAGKYCKSISAAMQQILKGHFTKEALVNYTLKGGNGTMSLFPKFVETLMGLLKQEDICRGITDKSVLQGYLETAIRSVKSNLRKVGKKQKAKEKKVCKRNKKQLAKKKCSDIPDVTVT